ncbi:ABC transporter permease [Filimonas zeae]|uniref:ABC transporter permease n=2 Tax=Filimonas zeae TaxID=1737353 RepID=A0A917IY15_9BACT|nr:ABC transporter permease [Filimonas zeae]
MLANYFKIAWRNLLNHRLFTLLNIAGLSVGLSAALLIWLWAADEWGMDKYNANDAQLYQVMQNLPGANDIETTPNTPGLLGNALATEFPEIERAATVVPASWFSSPGVITINGSNLKAKGQFVSKDFFSLFTCPVIQGNIQQFVGNKQAIALSDELAAKLFKNSNPLGKTIEWTQDDFQGNYVITAIFRKNPAHATERFDILFNYDLFVQNRPGILKWGNSDPCTYILLKENTDVAALDKKLTHFLAAKSGPNSGTLFLRKFSSGYLYGHYSNGQQTGGRIAYVKLFSGIAIFILLIACINFMNLSTAKATSRAREVGVQKALGASRTRLMLQYLAESVLASMAALAVALVLVALFLPVFNNITGKTLALQPYPGLLSVIVLITLLTGLLAGSYPAVYISGFRSAAVLKGALSTSASELNIRKALVVFQFTLSVGFIVAVLVIYRQLDYIQSKNLGYNRAHIIHFEIPLTEDAAILSRAQQFISELGTVAGVTQASSYYHNLTGDHGGIGGLEWPGKAPAQDISFANLEVGEGFLQTMGIRLKEGRYFSTGKQAESEIILNESAIQRMGLVNPLGKTISFWNRHKQIIGIAEDFHFESLYQKVAPCFFQQYPVLPNIMVKIQPGSDKQVLAQIKQLYERFAPGLAFDYRYLDEEYQALYASEKRVSVLARYFAVLAVFISCLGLAGLTAFTAQKRRKEIGVRKVVGASVTNVVYLLSKDFLRLVFIAACIAFPVSAWLMNSWLNSFAYRITIQPDIFLFTGLAVMLIALLTTSFQSLKAAMVNPVQTLRNQ